MMKTRTTATLALAAMAACVAGVAQATTVGFVGAGSNNAHIATGYASNIAADGAGWTVSDGTGATPDISLYWGGFDDSTGWDWQAHSAVTFQHIEALNAGGAWDAANPPTTNAVVQLQHGNTAPLAIQFSANPGVALVLNSLDIGNATDQHATDGTYGIHLELVKDSDASVAWMHDTPLWGLGDSGREETVAIGYTGDLGESYTLSFTRNTDPNDQGNDQVFRTGLDNLSFSQIPEPTSLALLAMCGLGLVSKRRRS